MCLTGCAYIVAQKSASMHESLPKHWSTRESANTTETIFQLDIKHRTTKSEAILRKMRADCKHELQQGATHTQYQNPESSPCKQKGSRTKECLTLSHRNTLKKFTGIWQATENGRTKQCTRALSMAQRSNQHTYTALHRFISTLSRKGSAILRPFHKHKWQRNGYCKLLGPKNRTQGHGDEGCPEKRGTWSSLPMMHPALCTGR